MSTLVSVMQPAMRSRPVEAAVNPADPQAKPPCPLRNFAEDQISRLVRQLFLGRGKSARHVVISAVDESTYIAEICMDVARELSRQVAGSVCVIEGNTHDPQLESVFGTQAPRPSGISDSPRDGCQQLATNLWLSPLRVLTDGRNDSSSLWLERRLSDFRLDFDYTVLHAPPAGRSILAAQLGQLSDGMALVLGAHTTRRAKAQKTRDVLQAANVRLLGAVLCERRFPIPEGLYNRL